VTTLAKAHWSLLERRRHALDLIGPGDVGPHFEDCKEALRGLDPTGRWVDVGSGAGFPGLVLAAMYPGCAVDLVESRKKRAVFLESVILAAADDVKKRGGPVRVIADRAESLPEHAYDGFTARAVAAPEELMKLIRRLVKPGGRAMLMVGPSAVAPPGVTVLADRAYTIDGKPRRAMILGV
jgi:16S rRNA (guanine527-N7)-methyltransferase